MAYPSLPPAPSVQDLHEHFTLETEDRKLLGKCRDDVHRLGLAVLLKVYQRLGYAPRSKKDVPEELVKWIAQELGVDPSHFAVYRWWSRSWRHHLRLVREHAGTWRLEAEDKETLTAWLIDRSSESPSRRELMLLAVEHCRSSGLELPRESRLRRIVDSARNRFLESFYEKVSAQVDEVTRQRMEHSLSERLESKRGNESETTRYDWMKSPPGRLGMNTILEEIKKLRHIREFQINLGRHFPDVSSKLLDWLRDRARAENAFQMRRHPPNARSTLLAALLYAREREVTDHIIRLLLKLIRRIEKKADKTIEKQLVRSIRKVFGKTQLLYRIAAAATGNPDGTVRDVLFSAVGEEVLLRLVDEAEQDGAPYEVVRARVVQTKYRFHYRRMMKPVLETLVFHATSPAQEPLLKGLALVRRHLESKRTYYPPHEEIPESLLEGASRELIVQPGPDGPRVAKHPFEVSVLRKLEKALKCKEVWVEGAYRFRNPDEDLPANWEGQRVEHYERRGFPLDSRQFLAPVRTEMLAGLEAFHAFLSRGNTADVHVRHPGGGQKGVFHVPRLSRRPERPILEELKGQVLTRWGILELLDILVEADRQVGFSQFFETSGQRQILSPADVQRRLLLVLFGLGTNLGLKRLHAASRPGCSYQDLRYFRDRYVTAGSVRKAIAALVNRILEVRNPQIWGKGTACASDGKHIGAWNQNLVAGWNAHRQALGVMVYWHVETNALCIHSKIKHPSSSEAALMIEGLVRHDTEMRVETNFVDSHGQSEVAFAFSRFLGFELMPRLKRIKHEKLYLPEKGLTSSFPEFSGVLAHPIRWKLIEEQYDDMVRHVVAVLEGTGPVESILRRFNSNNRNNPTYKAFIQLGKALKTIFLCRYLSHPELRQEINAALNIVENWNSIIEFIFYGCKSQLQTNDPELQEICILCLHLLQNAVILANTVMIERVLRDADLRSRFEPEDLRALTPLFTANVNPYGDFTLDIRKPSFLKEAA